MGTGDPKPCTYDLVVTQHQGLIEIHPNSDQAAAWLKQSCDDEALWDRESLWVEYGFAQAIVEGALEAGITVEIR